MRSYEYRYDEALRQYIPVGNHPDAHLYIDHVFGTAPAQYEIKPGEDSRRPVGAPAYREVERQLLADLGTYAEAEEPGEADNLTNLHSRYALPGWQRDVSAAPEQYNPAVRPAMAAAKELRGFDNPLPAATVAAAQAERKRWRTLTRPQRAAATQARRKKAVPVSEAPLESVVQRIVNLRDNDMSLRGIAATMGMPYNKVRRVLQQADAGADTAAISLL